MRAIEPVTIVRIWKKNNSGVREFSEVILWLTILNTSAMDLWPLQMYIANTVLSCFKAELCWHILIAWHRSTLKNSSVLKNT